MHQVYHGKRTFTKVEIAVFQSKDEIGPLLIERICYFPPFFFFFFFLFFFSAIIYAYVCTLVHLNTHRYTDIHTALVSNREVFTRK